LRAGSLTCLENCLYVIHRDVDVFGVGGGCAAFQIRGRVETGEDRPFAVEVMAPWRNALAGNSQYRFVELLGLFDVCHRNEYPVEFWHFDLLPFAG
jgi:hypothetical protein